MNVGLSTYCRGEEREGGGGRGREREGEGGGEWGREGISGVEASV